MVHDFIESDISPPPIYSISSLMNPSLNDHQSKHVILQLFKDGGNCKGAWYLANILNLRDGKAFVCYTELQADEGHLKEWVSVEDDGIKAPKIRIDHPATTMRVDGTRKRCRAAMMDYTWSVGDKVDAWMQDWWDCSFQYGSLVDEVDGHTTILYHRLLLDRFPMFVWLRDLCHARYWRRNDDGSYVVLFCSRENENCGPQPGYVQARIERKLLLPALQYWVTNFLYMIRYVYERKGTK